MSYEELRTRLVDFQVRKYEASGGQYELSAGVRTAHVAMLERPLGRAVAPVFVEQQYDAPAIPEELLK